MARLEAIRIDQELAELRAEEAKLRDLLASPAALRRTVVREIEADTKAFGDDRRTLIEAGKRSVAEIRVVDEPVTVVVSLKGWVRALKGHEVDPAQLGFKAGDGLSSTSFWWRRCSEQSRSPRWITLPWLSARTWISICRGWPRYFSM